MTTTIAKEPEVVKGKLTLVRRVSDLFRADGTKGGSPFFRQSSMEALRHCCQNLSLFPYLLYTLGRSSQDEAKPKGVTLNMCLALIVGRITERVSHVYVSVRQIITCRFRLESPACSGGVAAAAVTSSLSDVKPSVDNQEKSQGKIVTAAQKFEKFVKQKPRSHSWFLKLAVYLAPLVLAFQLVTVFSLIVLGKYTPGFVFLVSVLIFLGCISMKVLIHDSSSAHTFKRQKRKQQHEQLSH